MVRTTSSVRHADHSGSVCNFKVVVDKSVAAGAWMLALSSKTDPRATELHTVYQGYNALVLEYAKQLAAGAGSNLSPLVFIDTFQGMLVIGNANSLFKTTSFF